MEHDTHHALAHLTADNRRERMKYKQYRRDLCCERELKMKSDENRLKREFSCAGVLLDILRNRRKRMKINNRHFADSILVIDSWKANNIQISQIRSHNRQIINKLIHAADFRIK